MLNHIMDVTDNFLEKINKTERKKIGQFFTSKTTAIFMANLFNNPLKKDLNILDPGAGSGILSASAIEYLQKFNLNSIDLTIYENDENILPLLKSNCKYLVKKSKIPLKINIYERNFILDNSFDENIDKSFDLIISNPPFKKISKNDLESQNMLDIVYGSPNLYFLFMAMSLNLLKENGEMVFIVPRSWTSGSYFKKFRKYLLDNGKIDNIHLFLSRNNLFNKD